VRGSAIVTTTECDPYGEEAGDKKRAKLSKEG